MTFVTAGLAIAGALAIAIPIIIHLLWRQRRHPIEWAAMRFLIEALKKQKRRLQLEQLLLLLTRCLILALLGFALARPLLEAAGVFEDNTGRVVLVVIDNGLASAISEGGGSVEDTALRRHIEGAVSVIDALGEAEAVGLITAARPVETPILPPSLDHRAVIDVLESIESADTPTDIAGALAIVQGAVAEFERDGRTAVVYLFSDFRAGSAPLDTPLPALFDAAHSDSLLLAAPPATETRTNVQVVGISPVRRVLLPGAVEGSQQVTVSLARHGATLGRATTRVRLIGDGIGAPAPKEVQWSPGSSDSSVTFSLDIDPTSNEQVGITAIIEPAGGAGGGDALLADNRQFLTIDVRDRMRIALVSPPTFERIGMIEHLTPGQWIRRALQTSDTSPMEVVDVPPSSLDHVDLRGVDAAIVTRPDRLADRGWTALREFIDRGGLVVVTPPFEINVHPWTDHLASDLNLSWRLGLEVENHESGLLLADGQPHSELLKMLEAEIDRLSKAVVTYRTLPVVMAQTRATPVLMFEDGTPAMIMSTPDGAPAPEAGDETTIPQERADRQGLVVYLAVAPVFPAWTTLPTNMLMVPLFQEVVRQGMSIIRAAQNVMAGERPALSGLRRTANSLKTPQGKALALDASRRPTRPFQKAGMYEVLDAAGRTVGRVAVNLDPRAGRTETQSEAAVGAWLGESGPWQTFDRADPAAKLATAESGTSIAGMILFVVLALIVLETLLARRFSHAYSHGKARALSGGLRATVESRPAVTG